jgi:hypothetical protein
MRTFLYKKRIPEALGIAKINKNNNTFIIEYQRIQPYLQLWYQHLNNH